MYCGAMQGGKGEVIFVGAFQKKRKINRLFFSQWDARGAGELMHSTDNTKESLELVKPMKKDLPCTQRPTFAEILHFK